jgi:hypothetical protein
MVSIRQFYNRQYVLEEKQEETAVYTKRTELQTAKILLLKYVFAKKYNFRRFQGFQIKTKSVAEHSGSAVKKVDLGRSNSGIVCPNPTRGMDVCSRLSALYATALCRQRPCRRPIIQSKESY